MMRDLIASVPEIESAYQSGDDAAVISLLNDPVHQKLYSYGGGQPDGMQSNATMGDVLGQAALGAFLVVVQSAIDAATPGGVDAAVLSGMRDRFNTTIYGVDFANDELRAVLSSMFTVAGVDGQPYLDLGYTMVGLADPPATQTDIDDCRANDLYESYNSETSDKSSNAVSLFNSRWQADATASPPVLWDDAKKALEWALAWSDV